jgi:hypothetical protein
VFMQSSSCPGLNLSLSLSPYTGYFSTTARIKDKRSPLESALIDVADLATLELLEKVRALLGQGSTTSSSRAWWDMRQPNLLESPACHGKPRLCACGAAGPQFQGTSFPLRLRLMPSPPPLKHLP